MVLIGDPKGIIDEKKRYKDPNTGRVYTGKAWLSYMDRSRYDIWNVEWFRSFIEVKWNKETETWIEVEN